MSMRQKLSCMDAMYQALGFCRLHGHCQQLLINGLLKMLPLLNVSHGLGSQEGLNLADATLCSARAWHDSR